MDLLHFDILVEQLLYFVTKGNTTIGSNFKLLAMRENSNRLQNNSIEAKMPCIERGK